MFEISISQNTVDQIILHQFVNENTLYLPSTIKS